LSAAFSFFVRNSAALPDLPSFPTRRSSDLKPGGRQVVGERLACRGVAAAGERQRQFVQARIVPDQHQLLRVGCASGANGLQQLRSEEHTSELQSRRDLVCRLLLEKKKKKTM